MSVASAWRWREMTEGLAQINQTDDTVTLVDSETGDFITSDTWVPEEKWR